MAAKQAKSKAKNTDPENSFLLRWPVIFFALLFILPLGIILLITKFIGIHRKNREEKIQVDPSVPYAKWKTAADKEAYGNGKRRQTKRLITSLLVTVIFLVLGCASVTLDYLDLFWGNGFSGEFLKNFIGHGAFLVMGVFLCSTTYNIYQQQHRIKRLRAVIGSAEQVTVASLAVSTGFAEEDLRGDLKFMLEQKFFGHGARFDEAAGVLICRQ